MRGDVPRSLFNNTFPLGLGSARVGECVYKGVKNQVVCLSVLVYV